MWRIYGDIENLRMRFENILLLSKYSFFHIFSIYLKIVEKSGQDTIHREDT
jgi:hypothetical protein